MTFQRRAAAGVAALALSLSTVAVASPAEANQKFTSCSALTKVFKNGVAKNKKAAMRQVKQGNKRPAYGKRARKAYRLSHKSLDRDKDGTACEQS